MPHAVRRVYVARVGRIVAALTLSVGGAVLFAAACLPEFAALIRPLFPGSPAVLSSLLGVIWVLGCVSYLVGRSLGEHRFAVAMSRAVLPTEDLHHDVDRLAHERPDRVARDMVTRSQPAAVMFPVIAAGLVVPATGLFLARALEAMGHPGAEAFDQTLAANTATSLTVALFGLIYGAALGIPALRSRWFSSTCAPALGVAALLMWDGSSVTGAIAACASAVCFVAVVTLRRLRRERVLLDLTLEQEQQQGFDVRRGIRRALVTLDNARKQCTWKNAGVALVKSYAFARTVFCWPPSKRTVLAVVVLAAAVAYSLDTEHAASDAREGKADITTHVRPSQTATPVLRPALIPDNEARSLGASDGGIVYELKFKQARQFILPDLPALPAGWSAKAQVELMSIDGDADPDLLLEAQLGRSRGVTLSRVNPLDTLTTTNCGDTDHDLSLIVRVNGEGGEYQQRHVVLVRVTPVMTTANCSMYE
jgi:hypothetical protein